MAWLDAANIAITDTHPEEETDTNNDGYIDGTTDAWVNGRTVFTTEEWNALTTNGVSFQVKVEANEGIWVEKPLITLVQKVKLDQSLEETPYGEIFNGSNPNNYVLFNNEQWRILGVYSDDINGDMVKIVKSTPVSSSQKWNNTLPTYGSVNWDESDIKVYLNDTYYSTLSQNAKNMIFENATWDIGEIAASWINSGEYANVEYNNAISIKDTATIGMLSSYEFVYSNEKSDVCWHNTYYTEECLNNNWLFPVISVNKTTRSWLLNKKINNGSGAALIDTSGTITVAYMNGAYLDSYSTTPVVYLKSNVLVTGGNGATPETAYTLRYDG